MTGKKIDLIIPKWQLGVLLYSSAFIFLTAIVMEAYLGNLSLWFFIGSFLLFIPAYIILYLDIAARPITHLWSSAMLVVPVVTPFVYLSFRDELKASSPELV